VSNYGKAGPDTPSTAALAGLGSTTTAYMDDNVYEPNLPILTIWSEPIEATSPFDFPPVTTEASTAALERVLSEAGAWPRDAMNDRTVAEVRAGTGSLGNLSDPLIESGPEPAVDTDLDGMPDSWETDRGLDPADPSDSAADRDQDGYTNVEEYLSELAQSLVGAS
jgi:hypothetical protein